MDVTGVDCYNLCGTGNVGRTLATSSGGLNEHIPVVCYGVDLQGGKSNCGYAENIMPTLCSDSHGTPHALCYTDVIAIYDARGNGDGGVAPTLTGDHQNRITDYTAIVIQKVVLALGGTGSNASMTDGDKAPTMLARAGTGGVTSR